MGTARVKKMRARDELLENLKNECLEQLATVAKDSAKYAILIKQLIVQGLIKIEEQKVEIQCREEDKATVNKVVGEHNYL